MSMDEKVPGKLIQTSSSLISKYLPLHNFLSKKVVILPTVSWLLGLGSIFK